ncbi:VOC family protein [Paracidovorax sp. MALMAid1276]|uniref:VOC family protein n=1 Tax=Paracidovorax sp. MALMAid1276 TaxID=3411631 RepID=UPI003B9D9B3B
MSTMPLSGAVVFAKDIRRVAAFYEHLCALVVVHAERDHIVLESGTVQLVVHAIPPAIARTIQIAEPPVVREQTPIKLFFAVPDLAQARALALQWGGEIAPAAREWEARGFRACDGHDPEGNVVQFRQAVVASR